MSPEEAVDYGKQLLAAADRADAAGPPPAKPPARSWWGGKPKAQAHASSFEEKLEILRAAGRWYVFWGSRGHPIQAWY